MCNNASDDFCRFPLDPKSSQLESKFCCFSIFQKVLFLLSMSFSGCMYRHHVTHYLTDPEIQRIGNTSRFSSLMLDSFMFWLSLGNWCNSIQRQGHFLCQITLISSVVGISEKWPDDGSMISYLMYAEISDSKTLALYPKDQTVHRKKWWWI